MYDLESIRARLQDRKSRLFEAEQRLIRCFYGKLEALQDSGDPLFSMWQNELEFAYGALVGLLSPNAKIDVRELGALYGLENVNFLQLLKSIQTFYSVLIKLIAFDLARRGVERDAEPIQAVLSGEAFVRLGIANYCYEDWFSWILKYWDAEIEALCEELRTCLEAENTVPSTEAFRERFRPDSLKHIYETVIPKSIRHALGEYYTPDWLAARAIQNALAVCERSASELRFIDPTCGAGTFLNGVMRATGGSENVAGFDINALAVLTAKANFLAATLDRTRSDLVIPIYHYDVLNAPTLEGDRLVVDTDCDLICEIPLGLCEEAVRGNAFCAESFLRLLRRSGACERLSACDAFNQKIIANILLNRIFAFRERKADIVVGNPPWVNWEYLPPRYRAKSQHLWPEYGLFNAKGRDLSFSKEDISILITYVVIDRFLKERGLLSFVLRQAMFKSAQNGVGFRRFRLGKDGAEFRVMQVDDLSGVKTFEGINTRSALVLIRKGEKHTFPVPYNVWAAEGVERMTAFPAGKSDPSSIWINAPERLRAVFDALLGENPYKARTGVFTGGANAVYWLDVLDGNGETVRVRNLVDRAKRKVKAVTVELEPAFVYPMVQGSDISQWSVGTKSCILCPHTSETKMLPVEESVLRTEAPKTFGYLTGFREALSLRKGFSGWEKEIQARHFYAILRIGEYTFSKYKVAWRYIAQSFITAVISSTKDCFLGEKLCIPNEKVMYVGTGCKDEAYYLCGVLSSSAVRYCVQCYMNPTSISAHVLDKLNIPRFDPASALHQRIAAICEAGHQAGSAEVRAALQSELDGAVGKLYGLPEASLALVRGALKKK